MDNFQYRYAGMDLFDVNNGIGCGATLFVQGCTHHCLGCHNPSTWDFDGGKIFDKTAHDALFGSLSNDNIIRLTLSGGDPFDNLEFSLEIAKEFKTKYPNKALWLYTGYTLEEIKSKSPQIDELISLCDVIVDGEFILAERDLSLPFCGSRNQRIIYLSQHTIFQASN